MEHPTALWCLRPLFFPVLIDGIAGKVDPVIPEHAGSALVQLNMIEQAVDRDQILVVFKLVDVILHIVDHGLAVVKCHAEAIIGQRFDFLDAWYHRNTSSFKRGELSEILGVPHLQKLTLILFHPLFDKLLSFSGQVALCHLHRSEVEDADMLSVQSMEMTRLVLFRLEEHFDDDSIKTTNLRHFASTHPFLYFHTFILLDFARNVNELTIITVVSDPCLEVIDRFDYLDHINRRSDVTEDIIHTLIGHGTFI